MLEREQLIEIAQDVVVEQLKITKEAITLIREGSNGTQTEFIMTLKDENVSLSDTVIVVATITNDASAIRVVVFRKSVTFHIDLNKRLGKHE